MGIRHCILICHFQILLQLDIHFVGIIGKKIDYFIAPKNVDWFEYFHSGVMQDFQ